MLYIVSLEEGYCVIGTYDECDTLHASVFCEDAIDVLDRIDAASPVLVHFVDASNLALRIPQEGEEA